MRAAAFVLALSVFPSVSPLIAQELPKPGDRVRVTAPSLGIRKQVELTPLRGHLTLGVKGVHDAHTVSPGVSRTDR